MPPPSLSWYHLMLSVGTAATTTAVILTVYRHYVDGFRRNVIHTSPGQTRSVQRTATATTKCASDDAASDEGKLEDEERIQTLSVPRGNVSPPSVCATPEDSFFSKNEAFRQTVESLNRKSLLSVRDLSKTDLECILRLSSRCRDLVKTRGQCKVLTDKIMGSLFYEPSTRTRCSFEAAMKRLGGSVVAINDVASSSVFKGETLEDTARMLSSYCDCILVRHPEKGSAQRAMLATEVPIINAGDGSGEHPTQALLDLFTISSFFPTLLLSSSAEAKISDLAKRSAAFFSSHPLRIAFVGDLLHGRTVHSLARLLALYDVELYYVAPDVLQFPSDLEAEIRFIQTGQKFSGYPRQNRFTDIKKVLPVCDVIYMTRIQKERFSCPEEYEAVKNSYILNSDLLERLSPEHAKVLHPLPRLNELAQDVDTNKRQAYFKQAENGLYVRMAILSIMMGQAGKIVV